MHASSFMAMEYLATQLNSAYGHGSVLDVGSGIAESGQMSYRRCFEPLEMHYVGLDVSPGPNVDIVSEDPYKFPLEDASFEVVISGQAFEHIEFPWLTIREMARVLKNGGLAIIIAPSSGPEHRYPQDCWRFYPDGMKALARWAGLRCLHASTYWEAARRFDWGDTIGVLLKGGGEAPGLSFEFPRQGSLAPGRARKLAAPAWTMRVKRAYWALAGN